MGLKDRLAGFVPEQYKDPVVPETFDGFLAELLERDAVHVKARSGRRARDRRVDVTSGDNSAEWVYYVGLDAESKSGRKITFEYPLAARRTQDRPIYNRFGGQMVGAHLEAVLQDKWELTTFVTANALLKRVNEAIPDCLTDLMNGDQRFTSEEFTLMLRRAQAENIRPWTETQEESAGE